jgi:hypothetical protein
MGGQRNGYQYIYCLPPAGGRIRSQGIYLLFLQEQIKGIIIIIIACLRQVVAFAPNVIIIACLRSDNGDPIYGMNRR